MTMNFSFAMIVQKFQIIIRLNFSFFHPLENNEFSGNQSGSFGQGIEGRTVVINILYKHLTLVPTKIMFEC